jgi:hypothetical protein
VPEQLRQFSDARELVLSRNRVKTLPAWLGEFTSLEAFGAEDCGLSTLATEIARLPRLRRLEPIDNPITSLPLGSGAFPAVEILSIGEGATNTSAQFTASLDLWRFPWLRIVEQRYDVNTIEEIECRDGHDLWSNPRSLAPGEAYGFFPALQLCNLRRREPAPRQGRGALPDAGAACSHERRRADAARAAALAYGRHKIVRRPREIA